MVENVRKPSETGRAGCLDRGPDGAALLTERLGIFGGHVGVFGARRIQARRKNQRPISYYTHETFWYIDRPRRQARLVGFRQGPREAAAEGKKATILVNYSRGSRCRASTGPEVEACRTRGRGVPTEAPAGPRSARRRGELPGCELRLAAVLRRPGAGGRKARLTMKPVSPL